MTQPIHQMALTRRKPRERRDPAVELKVLTMNGGLTVEDAQVNQGVRASPLSQQHTGMTSDQSAISWRERKRERERERER